MPHITNAVTNAPHSPINHHAIGIPITGKAKGRKHPIRSNKLSCLLEFDSPFNFALLAESLDTLQSLVTISSRFITALELRLVARGMPDEMNRNRLARLENLIEDPVPIAENLAKYWHTFVASPNVRMPFQNVDCFENTISQLSGGVGINAR